MVICDNKCSMCTLRVLEGRGVAPYTPLSVAEVKYPLGYFSKHTMGVLSEVNALKRVNEQRVPSAVSAEGAGWWWGRTSILRVSTLYTYE